MPGAASIFSAWAQFDLRREKEQYLRQLVGMVLGLSAVSHPAWTAHTVDTCRCAGRLHGGVRVVLIGDAARSELSTAGRGQLSRSSMMGQFG